MNRDRESGIWPELKRRPKPQFVSDELAYITIKPNGFSQQSEKNSVAKPQKQFKDLFEIKSIYNFKKLNLL